VSLDVVILEGIVLAVIFFSGGLTLALWARTPRLWTPGWRLIILAIVPFIAGEAVTISEAAGLRVGGTAEICDLLAAALLVAGLLEHRRAHEQAQAQIAD
jgi:hypothetical protein